MPDQTDAYPPVVMDLLDRCRKARADLQRMAQNAASWDTEERLTAKIAGVALVEDYIRGTPWEAVTAPSEVRDA